MPDAKLILDIRYFESDVANVDGSDPDDVGKIVKLPKTNALTGARIARKLRELGFIAGGFHHLYVNFTTVLSPDVISYADRSVDQYHTWYRYVDVGVERAKINKLPASKKQEWLESTTLQVANYISGKNKKQKAIVGEVRDLLKAYGDALPIFHLRKETKSYSITVWYQIAAQSTAWVEYEEKKTGERRQGCFANLELYEDVLFLVSSVSFKSGTIVFKPRSSFTARLYNKRYKVPITIDIARLTIA